MGEAKNITVKPIAASDANRIVKACHYSGSAAINAFVHLGVFLDGKCGGAMQFGPSLQKSALLPLVSGTLWNEFLELNRMAFADWLPRNSESRAIAVAMRLIRKAYPWMKWVVSFADGTQCGDGTIYRASGFLLTAVKRNTTMWMLPDGFVFADVGLRASSSNLRKRVGYRLGEPFSVFKRRVGAVKVPGFQLRYLYFLKPEERKNLTVPILPFSEIERRGAGMYKGRPKHSSDAPGFQPGEGGAEPTRTLQESHEQ